MYGERILSFTIYNLWERVGEDALTNTHAQASLSLCRFSIFYCGCKQPKSIHIFNSAAKVRTFLQMTKEKSLFP